MRSGPGPRPNVRSNSLTAQTFYVIIEHMSDHDPLTPRQRDNREVETFTRYLMYGLGGLVSILTLVYILTGWVGDVIIEYRGGR